MDRVSDSFTQRLLQRASLRRSRSKNESSNSGEEASQRRANIVRAINETSAKNSTRIIRDDNNNESSSIEKWELSEKLVISESPKTVIAKPDETDVSKKTMILFSSSLNGTYAIATMSIVDSAGSPRRKCNLEQPTKSPSTTVDTEIYDEVKFLENALGDELNNTSVTYDDTSLNDKTYSDYEASDLISNYEFSANASNFGGSPMLLSEMQPRSSSTLNRSTNFDRSFSEKNHGGDSKRNSKDSKFRVVGRFLRELRRDLKVFVGCIGSSES